MGRKRIPFKGETDGKSAGSGEGAGTAVLEPPVVAPEDLAGGKGEAVEGKGGRALPKIKDIASGKIVDDVGCRLRLTAILKKQQEIERAEAVLSDLNEKCSQAGKAVGEQKARVSDLKRELADIVKGQKLLF